MSTPVGSGHTPRPIVRRSTASIEQMVEHVQSDAFIDLLPPASDLRAMRDTLRTARQPSIDRELETSEAYAARRK